MAQIERDELYALAARIQLVKRDLQLTFKRTGGRDPADALKRLTTVQDCLLAWRDRS